MTSSKNSHKENLKNADWELDFYSRPIIESDGKKRWQLLISSTQDFSGQANFQWEKTCPANEVNSIWLSNALNEALTEAKLQGWVIPKKLRCWRTSMKSMKIYRLLWAHPPSLLFFLWATAFPIRRHRASDASAQTRMPGRLPYAVGPCIRVLLAHQKNRGGSGSWVTFQMPGPPSK